MSTMKEKIRRGLSIFLVAALLAQTLPVSSLASAALPQEEGREASTEDTTGAATEKASTADGEHVEENAEKGTEESREETADETREKETGEQPETIPDESAKETEAFKAPAAPRKSSAARAENLPVLPEGKENQTDSCYVSLEIDGKTLYYDKYGLGVIAAFREAEGKTAVITILKGRLSLNGDGGKCVVIDNPNTHITLRMAEEAILLGNQKKTGVITVNQGTLVMESGKIQNQYWNREDTSDADCNSYGIYVTGNGKAVLCGGVIQTVATPLNTSYAVCVAGGSFTMTGGSIEAEQTGGSGVHVESGHAVIQGGAIRKVARGVCVSGENSSAEIKGSTEIDTVSLNGYGVYAENKGRITVTGSSVSGAKSGVYADTEGVVTVTDSRIAGTLSGGAYGLYSMGKGRIEVTNCQISSAWKGVYVNDGGSAVIQSSTVCGGSSGEGILAAGEGAKATITDSQITGGVSGHGVYAQQSGEVEIFGSRSEATGGANKSGVYVSSGGRAILHEGTFSGGQYALHVPGGKIGALLAADKSFFVDDQRISNTAAESLTGVVTVGVCEHKGATFRYEDNRDGTHNEVCEICGQPVGDAKPHAYHAADGSCLCGAQAAASVETEGGGTTYYESFLKAWEAARGKTARVLLFKDVNLGTQILRLNRQEESRITLQIPEGKSLVGSSAAPFIELSGGSLIISGGYIEGNISVSGGGLTVETGAVNGTVQVTGGSLETGGGEIKGRVVVAGDGQAVLEGETNIETNADEAILVSGNGRLVMTGGRAAGRVLGLRVEGGSVRITGGEISRCSDSGEGILVSGGNLTVDGSAHIIGYNHGISVSGGEVRIAGGVIAGDNSKVYNSVSTGLVMTGGSVTVTGGALNGTAGSSAGSGYGVFIYRGSFTAEGGSFSGTGKLGYGIFTYEKANTIKGGRFTGSTCGMFLAKDASAALTGGIFQGGANGRSIEFLAADGQVGSLPAESYAYREVSIDGEEVTKGNWVTETDRLGAASLVESVAVAEIPVSLTGQPEDAEVPYGYPAAEAPVLKVTAKKADGVAEEITYQWYRELGDVGPEKIEGACGAGYRVPVGLTIPEGSRQGEYRYSCEVSCDGYVRRSETALVTVKQARGKIEGLSMEGWTYGQYDGTVHVPSYTCNSEGKVTAEYRGKSEPETAWTARVPSEAGAYLVRVRLEETIFYTGAEATAEFVIAKAEPSLTEIHYEGPAGDVICDGKLREAEAFPADGVNGLGIITLRYGKVGEEGFLETPPLEFGTYEVFADVEEGDNYLGRTGLKLGEFKIIPYETDAKAQAPEEWTRSAVITAPEGFAIGTSPTGDFGSQLIYEKETGPEGDGITYYLKQDGTGYLTEGRTVQVKVDRTGPSFAGADGGIQINGRELKWKELLTGLSFGLYGYGPGQIKVRAEDSLSGLGQVFCYIDREPGETALTRQELEELEPDSWTELTASSFELTENGTYVIYVWAADKTGNRSDYICSDGIVIDDGTSGITTRTVIEKGIRNIPEELKSAGFDTEEKILAAMSRVILSQAGYTGENMEIYDVKLQISLDGGKTWVAATKENFPSEGLTVTIPYPAGTNQTDYEFVVTHMFTQEMNGYRPGEIEMPEVIRAADGLRFTVKGLSPITVAWKKAAAKPEDPGTDPKPGIPEEDPKPDTPKPGTSGQTKPGSVQTAGEKGSTASLAKSPQTKDETVIWPWFMLFVLSGGWMLAVVRRSGYARAL